MNREPIFLPEAPFSAESFSPAVAHGGVLYVSGQLPINPATGRMLDRPLNPLFGGGNAAVVAQTRQCLTNIDALCRAAGVDLSHTIRFTVYTPVLIEFGAAIDGVCREFFTDRLPARSMIGVQVLQGNALVQIDATVALA